ncbi:MAG: zf-HC2 domain-containing protein [Candidatus Poribacteria bacterium]|nr:zf-HC2 domain-containing protein [Candidatus Poribacteria bacterium]MDE0505499.1 zf-HC2 domain-containing protein [Candidatus Poribacteria bacterium]
MSHKRIQNQLSAYLDDQLSPENRARIEAHLNTCDECVEMLSDFRRNRQCFGALKHEAPPIADLVLPQLSDRGPVRRRLLPSAEEFRRWFFRPVTGGTFAVVSACLLFALVYLNLTPTSDDSLDLYLSEHTRYSVYSTRSEDANDSIDLNGAQSTTNVEEDTDFLLEVFLGE